VPEGSAPMRWVTGSKVMGGMTVLHLQYESRGDILHFSKRIMH